YVPDLARGALNKRFLRGVFNGWQMSGITTFQTGTPIPIRFAGDLAQASVARGWFGTDAFNNMGFNTGAIAPVYVKNPTASNDKKIGDKILDINSIGIPAFGQTGPGELPFYARYPSRSNFDVSFFKNFKISDSKSFQFRTGLFNIFNQAYPTKLDYANLNNPNLTDVYLQLNTVCNVKVTVPNGIGGTTSVCDPTQGFHFDD